MNKTKIEWCDDSWNPVTGCFHGCEYCYARRIAERFGLPYAPKLGDIGMRGACKYDSEEAGQDTMLELEIPYIDENGRVQPYPMAFFPTFHKYRLEEPAQKTRPRNIFVCSMADLFGEWVPNEWIKCVFTACDAAPQHRYLFLTKNPAKYIRLEKQGIIENRDNIWLGSTVTSTNDTAMWCKNKAFHSFVSVEPMLEELHLPEREYCPEWVIIGAETGIRKNKVVPEKKWVMDLVEECDDMGIPVFMKNSMLTIVGEENMRREFPWKGNGND